MTDLSAAERGELMEMAYKVEAAYAQVFQPAKINLRQLGNVAAPALAYYRPLWNDASFSAPIWATRPKTRYDPAARLTEQLASRFGPPMPSETVRKGKLWPNRPPPSFSKPAPRRLRGTASGLRTSAKTVPPFSSHSTEPEPGLQIHAVKLDGNSLARCRLSGFAEHTNRANTALTPPFYNAIFTVTNQQAGSRRFQRFAGTDAQRRWLPRVASGRVATPKVLMFALVVTVRRGFCRISILLARRKDARTRHAVFGFGDVCAGSSWHCWQKAIWWVLLPMAYMKILANLPPVHLRWMPLSRVNLKTAWSNT